MVRALGNRQGIEELGELGEQKLHLELIRVVLGGNGGIVLF